MCFFFFSSRRRHTRWPRDWSSDVCSSDLDHRRFELAQARNAGDATVHQIQKALSEYGAKLDAAEKSGIEAAIKEVEEVLKGDDKEAIEAKTRALMAASQKLGEKMYADTQAQAAGSGPSASQSAEPEKKPADDVVDADYREGKRG